MSVVVGVLLVTAAGAQEGDRAARMACLTRTLDAWLDTMVLLQITPLQLTEAQLASLAAIYQQYPPETPSLATVQEAADKVEAFRRQLLAGTPLKPGDMEAMGKLLQAAFGEFGGPPDKPATELTPQDKLVWAVLTTEQQGMLLGGAGAGDAATRALAVLNRLREADDETWLKMRDRLADLLSASAGEEGTPARANARQMILDFLNRVRAMTDGEFASKQKELGVEAGMLVPAGANLGVVLVEFDPAPVHAALTRSLLSPRAPALLRDMQAARAKPAGG
jgi:hypothetical protein